MGKWAYTKGAWLLWWLLAWQCVQAQEPELQLSFKRQNNFTYTTIGDLNYRFQKDKYRFHLTLHHDHLLNSSRRDNPFIQFYVRTYLWQFWDWKEKFSFASLIESDIFFNSENQRHTLYFGAEYRPIPQLKITPLFGYSWDYRSGILDQGFSPAIYLDARHEWDDGLKMQTQLYARTKQIDPRHQRNLVFSSFWGREIGELAELSFGLKIGSNEIDNYRNSTVEKIKSDTLMPMLSLRYRLMEGLFWETENQMRISRRQFDYVPFQGVMPTLNNLAFNQTEFYSLQKLAYRRTNLRAFFSYEYEYIIRRYNLENSTNLSELEYGQRLEREQQKDYLRNLNAFEVNMAWQVDPRHELVLTGSNRYLQYDTPSESNYDDHDEITYALGTEWKARWSRTFFTRYKITGNVRKYAFLFKERSQDNYTQQSLRLEFDYRWEPLRYLSIRGSQFIYVTYNIKDFVDLNRTDRSTRNLETKLDIDYRFSKKWRSTVKLYRKEWHVSYINWETFTETTLDTNHIFIAEWQNQYRLKSPFKRSRLFADFGYKHLNQRKFQNTAMLNTENVLVPINLHIRSRQTGPVTGFRLIKRAPASISLSIWWQLQIQDFEFREVERFSTLSASYRQQDLETVTTTFRPFIQFQANMWLGK